MKFPALTLLLLTLVQSPASNIEGIVRDSQTGQPIAGTQVGITLVSGDPLGRSRPTTVQPVTTDAEGGFRFVNVPAGRYRVWAAGGRYAVREFGSLLSGGAGKETGTVLDLSASQSIKNISVELEQAGTISGRVLATTGQPLVGIEMLALRSRYNESGIRFLATEASGWTDDRGEYRLSGISPGQYYVVARGAIRMVPPGSGFPSVQDLPEPSSGKYSTTYFPSSVDSAHATLLEVASGKDSTGTNFILARSSGRHIRGHVIEEATGRPVYVGFTLLHRPTIGPLQAVTVFGPAYNRLDGTFDIRFGASPEEGFAPGAYWLIATRISGAGEAPLAGLSGRPTARVPIDLPDSDLDNIQVLIRKPVSLKGRISVEGQQTLPDLSSLRIFLLPRTDFPWVGPLGAPLSEHTPIGPDGSFLFENLIPDTYDISINGLPGGVYPKDIQIGEMDVLGKPIVITGPPMPTLNVVLSAKAATVDGVLRDATSQPLAYREVVLIPDGSANRGDLYKKATTDSRGAFVIEGIAPGTYKLFAWGNAEPFAYFDPEFISRFLRQGSPIAATESSRHHIDIRQITSPDR